MSREFIVENTPYTYPDAGDSPGWGEGATDWAQAVTNALVKLINANDILETSFTIANNQAVATDITGLFIDVTQVRAVEIDYSVRRTTDVPAVEVTETGKIIAVYENNSNTWSYTRTSTGDDTGTEITVTPTGQFQYTSTDISGTNYTGLMKFRAKALIQ